MAKKFCKSVHFCQSYGESKFPVFFWLPVYIVCEMVYFRYARRNIRNRRSCGDDMPDISSTGSPSSATWLGPNRSHNAFYSGTSDDPYYCAAFLLQSFMHLT